MVGLVRDGGTSGEREGAAGALCGHAFNNADNQVAIAAAGGIAPLVGLVRDGGTSGEREEAAGALWGHAFNNADNQVAIAAAGGIAPLVGLVRDEIGRAHG